MATFKLQPIIGSTPTIAPYDGVDVIGNSIRYVGSSTPNTTAWAVNDVWIDNIAPTTPVVRVWTGAVFQPARSSGASLFTDLFTGTNGVAVSGSNWVTASTPVSGSGYSFTYQDNTGWLQGGSGNQTKISRSVNITNPTDANVSCSIKFPASGVPKNVVIFTRANSAIDSQTGYSATITPGKFFLNKWVSFTATDFNPGGTSFSYANDTWYSVRLRTVGSTIQGKIWVTASAEPATWTVTVTDTTYTTAGYIGVQLLNQASGNNSVYFDNFVVDPT